MERNSFSEERPRPANLESKIHPMKLALGALAGIVATGFVTYGITEDIVASSAVGYVAGSLLGTMATALVLENLYSRGSYSPHSP